MAASNFAAALKLVLAHEGGYVDHPRDPGGATNLGITIAVLGAWRGKPVSKADVRKLSRPEAAEIYRRQYWDAVRGDDLPAGLDYAVFDFAVNSGVRRAVEFLQAVVGVAVDGHIGEVTIAAAGAKPAIAAIKGLCQRRLAWLKKLKTWRTFGKGWARRVAGVEAAALEMAMVRKPIAPTEVAALVRQAGAPTPKADGPVRMTSTVGGKGMSATAIGTIGAGASEAAEQLQPVADYAAIVKWVFIALLVLGVALTLYATWRNQNREADDEAAVR